MGNDMAAAPAQPVGDVFAAGPEAGTAGGGLSLREVVTVPILSIRPGESPRLDGEDKAHIARLAEADSPLPPILVDRRNMRVVDGMHRLLAASLKGQETINVEFFEGSAADVFLRAVQENVTHGLPLSRADRHAAAARIMASHPDMSDRAIAASTGLGARTVGRIRRSADALPQLDARVGMDGRVRPLNSGEGRRRVAALLAERPQASLREVARDARVSPSTVSDVRKRLARGDAPEPAAAGASQGGQGRAGGGGNATGTVRAMRGGTVPGQVACQGESPGTGPVVPGALALLLEKLRRDPSLRHKERGRQLLRWLQFNATEAQDWPDMAAAMPPHCAAAVAKLARHNSMMWLDFARELDNSARAGDPWSRRLYAPWLCASNGVS